MAVITGDRLPISIIVLTYNEEVNIEACLRSVYDWAGEIFVVDSGSTDRTLEIAGRYTDQVFYHPFESWGAQVNWALDNLPFSYEWVLRLDADETVTPELAQELGCRLPALPDDVTALYCKRRVYFLGKWIRHGGYYPTWLLRIFRRRSVRYERHYGEAEHAIILTGSPEYLKHDIIDYNHKGLAFWTIKHEGYAAREVASLLGMQPGTRVEIQGSPFGTPEVRKRWLKKNVYGRLPLFVRAFIYFLYRYILRLGFLDGIEGLIFHFLQGCWYRFYVDAKIWEAKRQMADRT